MKARSKSGADFEKQFAEDAAVFRRYAPAGGALALRKRLRTFQIVSAYRLLRALRGARREGVAA